MAQSNTNQNAVPVSLGLKPPEGPRAVPISYDFSTGDQVIETDLVYMGQQGRISMVQSIFVDNATGGPNEVLNNQTVLIRVADTDQVIAVPPGAQMIVPILVTNKMKFTVSTAGAGVVGILYFNDTQNPFTWNSSPTPVVISGTVPVSDAILDATVSNNRVNVTAFEAAAALTDRSGTIAAGGVSQQIAAANAARRGWSLQNLDPTENLYVNVGAAAAIDTPGSYLLAPFASIQLVGTAAINVIAATVGHEFTAKEW